MYPYLQAQLSRGSSVLSSVSVDVSGFFDFPPVPIQEEVRLSGQDNNCELYNYVIYYNTVIVAIAQ